MSRKLKRSAQSFVMKASVKIGDAGVARAFKKLVEDNENLFWPLWISYCNLRRKFGFSAYYAFETMYNEFNHLTNYGCAIFIEKIKSDKTNMTNIEQNEDI